MAGTCLGARHGTGAWPSCLTGIDGINAAIEVAERISQTSSKTPAPTTNPGDSDPVHVSFLVDRSGSMSPMVDDVVGGFNEFVENQKQETSDCTMTLVQFDSQDPYEIIHNGIQIGMVPELTRQQYQPRGGTPLLDALGTLISRVDQRLVDLGTCEDQIVVVFTDGYENSSTTWNRSTLFQAIESRRAAGWTFVYLGANQDSYDEAGRLGFEHTNTQNFRGDGLGTRSAMRSVDRAVSEYRRSSAAEKLRRKKGLFDGTKEAESDHTTR
jgi:hypothetical protein